MYSDRYGYNGRSPSRVAGMGHHLRVSCSPNPRTFPTKSVKGSANRPWAVESTSNLPQHQVVVSREAVQAVDEGFGFQASWCFASGLFFYCWVQLAGAPVFLGCLEFVESAGTFLNFRYDLRSQSPSHKTKQSQDPITSWGGYRRHLDEEEYTPKDTCLGTGQKHSSL